MTRFAPLALCFELACWTSSQTAPAQPPTPVPTPTPVPVGEIEPKPVYGPFSIEVIGLDVISTTINTTVTQQAHELTEALRNAVREHKAIRIAPGPSRHALINHRIAANCPTAHPSCMVLLATHLRVDRLVYGEINGQSVTLELLVAATQQVVKWSSQSFDFSSNDTIRAGAREAMASLLSRSP